MALVPPIRPPIVQPLVPAYATPKLPWEPDLGSVVFDPTQVPGRLLDLWATVESTTITGSGVSSWRDQVAAYDFVQATNANRPPFTASWRNGHPALDFNGTSQRVTHTFLADELLAAGNDCTLYMFGELDTLSGVVDNTVIDFVNGAVLFILQVAGALTAGWYDGAWQGTGLPATGAHSWCWALDSGVVNGSTVYQDGVSLGTVTVTNNGLGGATFVGCESSPSALLDGKIGRLLLYSGLHDTVTRNNILGWGRGYYALP